MTGEMPWSSLVSLEEPQLSEVHDRAVTACCGADTRDLAMQTPTCNGGFAELNSMAHAVIFDSASSCIPYESHWFPASLVLWVWPKTLGGSELRESNQDADEQIGRSSSGRLGRQPKRHTDVPGS